MKSELFIECAKNVVDFYNLTQESIGSKNRMEYPKVIEEKKPREVYVLYNNGKPLTCYDHNWGSNELKLFREVIE